MSIDPSLWTNNISCDLRVLSDSICQAEIFSGRSSSADSHPGEIIATIWDDDRLESFVAELPEGSVRWSGLLLINAINRLVEVVDFDSSWQLIVSSHEWQEVVKAAAAMLQSLDAESRERN